MTLRGLVWLNILWNTLFVLMAGSEMTGVTAVHPMLPWYLKWWWICGLASGNLIIHCLMLYRINWLDEHVIFSDNAKHL